MRRCAIPLPDSEVKIIGFGAYHGSAKTETAELIVLKRLIEERRLGYYLPEVDFCLAYYFNEYLLSGDDDLLQSLVLQYGERVPQEKSMECYNKWRSLRKILCENNYRITVIGTDALYSYEFAMRYLRSEWKTFAIHIMDLPGCDRYTKNCSTEYPYRVKSSWMR